MLNFQIFTSSHWQLWIARSKGVILVFRTCFNCPRMVSCRCDHFWQSKFAYFGLQNTYIFINSPFLKHWNDIQLMHENRYELAHSLWCATTLWGCYFDVFEQDSKSYQNIHALKRVMSRFNEANLGDPGAKISDTCGKLFL